MPEENDFKAGMMKLRRQVISIIVFFICGLARIKQLNGTCERGRMVYTCMRHLYGVDDTVPRCLVFPTLSVNPKIGGNTADQPQGETQCYTQCQGATRGVTL